MKYWINTLILTLFSPLTFAQESGESIEMADVMRSNGKIYVVVGVLLIIFVGLIVNMVRLEKKMNRIEKEIKA
ncbi:CcmD family protein [Phaeocystidibacter marisrubri]|uniref:CcmD family protein n=1 Tax=Phaeocystidibacter marisrubri TaxID=1577780 RepID=A0A6L3ZJQ6_9FLAO|nr:CcmD family protein [Phaeocystidibacter marisrubri]KAB2818174.1 CcmD family protein [Phaeocystidibacter marisrubri]GGH71563.1 hypothetical protein GCM10011318_14650 [Phaeocystidibacter marisrubri]